MKARLPSALAVALALAGAPVAAQALKPYPLAQDHPIVGRWTYRIPDSSCTETYHFRTDGTTVVTSGEEIAESVFEISAEPGPDGYYKWTDELVKDNGKKDCSGTVTQPGKVVTTYILFNPAGDAFIVCAEASLDACFGPFRRARGTSI